MSRPGLRKGQQFKSPPAKEAGRKGKAQDAERTLPSEDRRWTNESVVAIVSAAVAIASLIFSGLALRLANDQNRMMIESLEKSTLSMTYQPGAVAAVKVTSDGRHVVEGGVMSGLLTNTGRVPITVLGLLDEWNEPVPYEWVPASDLTDVAPSRDPFLMSPGEAVLFRVCLTEGMSPIFLPSVVLSDGTTKSPEYVEEAPMMPVGINKFDDGKWAQCGPEGGSAPPPGDN